MNRVSFHTTIDNIGDREVYQVFLGSPRRYLKPDATRLEGIEKDIVVHSPYWVNMAKDSTDENFKNTLSYSVAMARELQRVGQKYYVTHIGARYSDMSVGSSMNYIRNFCEMWLWNTKDTDVTLCLENDSGSKKGTKMGSIKVLETIIRDIDNPRLRMTFDSEHAYANGFRLDNIERLRELSDIIAVVHFNSIPQMVGRGSHVDRHSETTFKDCKNGFGYLYNVYEVLYDGVRPFIMELNEPFVQDNLEYLKNFLGPVGKVITV